MQPYFKIKPIKNILNKRFVRYHRIKDFAHQDWFKSIVYFLLCPRTCHSSYLSFFLGSKRNRFMWGLIFLDLNELIIFPNLVLSHRYSSLFSRFKSNTLVSSPLYYIMNRDCTEEEKKVIQVLAGILGLRITYFCILEWRWRKQWYNFR